MHPFYMLGVVNVYNSFVCSDMHDSFVTFSLIKEIIKNESINHGSKFG